MAKKRGGMLRGAAEERRMTPDEFFKKGAAGEDNHNTALIEFSKGKKL